MAPPRFLLTAAHKVRLPGALDAYLAQALPPGSVLSEHRRGHPIPLYDGPARIASRRICLTGDAASLVDPIMGEGIRFAIWSGQIAAQLIAAQLAGETPLDHGLTYSRRIHDAFGAAFDRQRRYIQPIFFKSPERFFARFVEGGASYALLAEALGARLDSALSPPFAAARADSSRVVQS